MSIRSIILVLIFQNLLIAFMNAAFDKANKAGHTVAYKYYAGLIAEYEALEKPLGILTTCIIYYIPDSDIIDAWLKETKKDEKQKLRLTGVNLDKLTNFESSIILVLIFQNLLIAFMNAAFDKANKAGHTVAYKYYAGLIAEYEALEKPLVLTTCIIYYIPDSDIIDAWLKETKKDEKQKLRLTGSSLTIDLYFIEPSTTKYNGTIDKISFIDEEIFP
ncbi:hypothetical protein Glove_195g27 [Diversispora epigaea]|uniref:Uncharacterized protein n=1 Tax=Diversispora epigaea TaxID=1348612 RepID=A0A397IL47_9GLOM|nr:hypothetical protein Glove_195g27 [Diversispora epigaea]